MPANNTKPVSPKSATAVTEGKIKKKSTSRPVGRPHRRLPAAKLETRIQDLRKKIHVQTARTTLLKDRLEVYERESTIRETETATE